MGEWADCNRQMGNFVYKLKKNLDSLCSYKTYCRILLLDSKLADRGCILKTQRCCKKKEEEQNFVTGEELKWDC